MSRFRVDLRSDTVSTPSAEMRAAMVSAEVGDAWYGDDPTVNRLQELAAERLGKEAALYVPTGTMANQIALALHVRTNGHLVACSAASHVATTEIMTAAVLSGIAFRTTDPGPRGWIDADQARALLEPDTYYEVEVVDLLSVENTLGGSGGRVMPVDELRAVRKVADEAAVPVHLDGARLFNAAAAAGVDAQELAHEADTVMFCVSKGLGAPIGSLLCGPSQLMPEVRRLQILFGGAWRQAGITAAAGIVALQRGPERLHEDHERASRLAEGVADRLPGSVDLAQVETNMVFVETESAGLDLLETVGRLEALGVGVTHGAGKVRMVTHVDVSDDGVAVALDARGQRLVKTWPVLHYGPIPNFDGTNWDLEVSGLVENPFRLSYGELRALPNVTVDADMHCVTGWTTLDNAWEGVSFRTLVERAKPKPEAKWVIAECAYGYTSDLSLEAMADDDVLLAWRNRGEDLTVEHGWPLRLVVPKRYAWKSAKWLTGLRFSDKNERGFWEQRGYHVHGEPFGEERYSYQEGPRAELQP